jgi:c-di-GMP-binding flagellar brake protein YcgR
MSDSHGSERRRYPRVKAKVPVEMRSEANSAPSRAVTEEISLCGCYIETMFTLDIGARVALTLWLDEQQIHTGAVIATRYPQVGNGFEFIEITSEDRLKLNSYILKCQQESTKSDSNI